VNNAGQLCDNAVIWSVVYDGGAAHPARVRAGA
jgi:hypothetical protein